MIRIGWPQRFKRKLPDATSRPPSSPATQSPTHHPLTRLLESELNHQRQSIFDRAYQTSAAPHNTELEMAALDQCAIILAPLFEHESLADYTRRVMMELSALGENYTAFGCDTDGHGLAIVRRLDLFVQERARALIPAQ